VTVTAPEKVNIAVKRAGNTIKTKDFINNLDMLSFLNTKVYRSQEENRKGGLDPSKVAVEVDISCPEV